MPASAETNLQAVNAAFAKLEAAGTDWRAESAAVKELAALGGQATWVLEQAAQNHADVRVRRACYGLLTDAYADAPRAMTVVADDGLNDADPQIRYICAFQLGEHKHYAAHRRLRIVMDDPKSDELLRLGS